MNKLDRVTSKMGAIKSYVDIYTSLNSAMTEIAELLNIVRD